MKSTPGSRRAKALKASFGPLQHSETLDRPAVVAYLRVSTEGQLADGFGMDVQERSVKAFAESQGYDLIEIVSERSSGAVAPDQRPGFSRVLKLAKRRAFSILLLPRFDRLARNVVHAVNTVHELRDLHSVKVRSVTEPIDTSTPMGEMIFTVLASMAAQERSLILERTWGGRKEKAMRGGFAGGEAPFGYRKDAETKGLVVVAEEAEVVRRMFDLRKQGMTLKQVADTLNADGAGTKRGKRWWPSSVNYVLSNPKYEGYVEYVFSHGGQVNHVLKEGSHVAIL